MNTFPKNIFQRVKNPIVKLSPGRHLQAPPCSGVEAWTNLRLGDDLAGQGILQSFAIDEATYKLMDLEYG